MTASETITAEDLSAAKAEEPTGSASPDVSMWPQYRAPVMGLSVDTPAVRNMRIIPS